MSVSRPQASRLADRVKLREEHIITRMANLAEGLTDVIRLGRGDPDLATPEHIVRAGQEALGRGETHYGHPLGLPALRTAIADNIKANGGADYAPDEIVVTPGGQHAMFVIALSLLNPGDEIIVPCPGYNPYTQAAELADATIVPVRMTMATNFTLTAEMVERHITPKSKILVLINPNNPTGTVTPPDEVEKIAALAVKHDLIVVSDEIYAKIIYEGNEHLSIGTLPGMKERTITLNGFSKTYAMTGWRVGYLAAPADFVTKVTEMRHSLSINTCTVSQYAALAALEGPREPIDAMIAAYAERRAFLLPALDEMGLTYGNPGGAFYVYINVSGTGLSTPDFCEKLLRETGVMLFPGTMFGDHDPNYIRLSFLQPLPVLKEAVERMRTFMNRLGKAAA